VIRYAANDDILDVEWVAIPPVAGDEGGVANGLQEPELGDQMGLANGEVGQGIDPLLQELDNGPLDVVEGGGAPFEADNLVIIRVEGGVAVDQGANGGNGIGGNADDPPGEEDRNLAHVGGGANPGVGLNRNRVLGGGRALRRGAARVGELAGR
jgi:hypothetical protein